MFTLQQAADETGKAKSTIFRAIRNGRLSAAKTEGGNFQIDPAELFRVFDPVPAAHAETMPAKQTDTGLETEVKYLRQRCNDLERERDRWHDAHSQLLRALPAPNVPPAKQSWWPFRFRNAG